MININKNTHFVESPPTNCIDVNNAIKNLRENSTNSQYQKSSSYDFTTFLYTLLLANLSSGVCLYILQNMMANNTTEGCDENGDALEILLLSVYFVNVFIHSLKQSC